MDAIVVNNLTKTYSGRTAADHLSFRVKQGEVFGLLGANGAGKSTTLECILGTRQMDSGEVTVLGLKQGKAVFYGTVAEAKKISSCEKFEDAYLVISGEEEEV